MSNRKNSSLGAIGITRRQMVTSAGMAFASVGIGSMSAYASVGEEISHTAEAIHQERIFKASPVGVYNALTETDRFDKIVHLSAAMRSGMSLGNKPTQIAKEEGGAFTLFGGHIVGRHIELVPHVRIVQAWRVADWNSGVYSIVRFELAEQGSETRLVFDHTGFPEGKGQHLADGWQAYYWEPLEKYLA